MLSFDIPEKLSRRLGPLQRGPEKGRESLIIAESLAREGL